jgi:hypothetical protein
MGQAGHTNILAPKDRPTGTLTHAADHLRLVEQYFCWAAAAVGSPVSRHRQRSAAAVGKNRFRTLLGHQSKTAPKGRC